MSGSPPVRKIVPREQPDADMGQPPQQPEPAVDQRDEPMTYVGNDQEEVDYGSPWSPEDFPDYQYDENYYDRCYWETESEEERWDEKDFRKEASNNLEGTESPAADRTHQAPNDEHASAGQEDASVSPEHASAGQDQEGASTSSASADGYDDCYETEEETGDPWKKEAPTTAWAAEPEQGYEKQPVRSYGEEDDDSICQAVLCSCYPGVFLPEVLHPERVQSTRRHHLGRDAPC